MKKCLFFLVAFEFFSLSLSAQKFKVPLAEALHRYEILHADTVYRFYAIVKTDAKFELNKIYTGYYNDSLYLTQGSVTGKLVHGSYMVYYPNGNLEERGNYKYGLKNGEWKEWDPTGTIIKITNWQEGNRIEFRIKKKK